MASSDTKQPSSDIGVKDARQAVTTGHVRWILRISLVLATVALAAVGGWYALRSPASHAPATAESTAQR